MSLFGYYSIGLQSLNVARLGLEVAGNNIANVFTPGFARREMQLTTGYPVSVPGGFLDSGVNVASLRRMEDQFLQASLFREQGAQAGADELLGGLRQLESVFGSLDSEAGLASSFARFSSAFSELASQPDSVALRRGAVSAADDLARSIGDADGRLRAQRSQLDQKVGATVERVNTLAEGLAALNREIGIEEATGQVAAPLRDQRQVILEELSQLTGGSGFSDDDGAFHFSLPGGPTLVSGTSALPLGTSVALDGTLRVHSGADGSDITDRTRSGRLGSQLEIRDDEILGRLTDLDSLAEDFAVRANALTTSAFDVNGNPGEPLFLPDPPSVPGAAAQIRVNPALLDDPALLAISSTGAAGEGDVALLLAGLSDDNSAALGDRSASAFLADMISALGHRVAKADVEESVARSVVESTQSRIDAVSGVSLDEEAANLVRFQQSYEAAARFMQVLNNVTEVAVNLIGR